jgi:hypothetical protein
MGKVRFLTGLRSPLQRNDLNMDGYSPALVAGEA